MKTLETERLILREIKPEDLEAMHSYASKPENIIYMMWGPNTKEQTQEFINMAIQQNNESPRANYHFSIILNDTLIGACSIEINDNEAELGWLLHRNHWKNGYATEVGKELLRFGFDELSLHRIIARCDSENIGSYKVMERLHMRREGLFLDSRPAHKLSDRKYGDELRYAILKDEWDSQKEIDYYNSLPCEFKDFIEVPQLSNGEIYLVCTSKNPANPEKQWVPAYEFAICKNGEKIGDINLRIGYGGVNGSSLYYGGQIGYGVDEKYRGNGYAVQACQLLAPVAKAHGMTKLLITNNYTNIASKRVCEKLGAKLIRCARVPEWHDMYERGIIFTNIFEWTL